MRADSFLNPSAVRVIAFSLVIALAANVFLWGIVSEDDTFANIISVASLVAAIGLVVSWVAIRRLLNEFFLLSFVIWVANAIEFYLTDGPRWESHVRQCGFYLAFAFLSLGAYVSTRVGNE